VIRSGCYVTQDGGHYDRVSPLGSARGGPLRNAMEVWGVVLSRPEPGLAVTSFGRRDVPYDMGLPAPVWLARDGERRPLEGCETIALSDQHGHVRVPADLDIRPGDLLGATISHPCGAFDRWRLLPVVDDAYDVVDAVTTVF
jgi:D-serine dehydratase